MRRNRNSFYEDKDSKKIFIISLLVLVVAILSFVITYVIYSNALDKKMNVAEVKKSSITDLSNTEKVSEASSTIGKTVNEVQNEEINKNEVNKIAINTSNIINTSEKQEEIKTEEPKQEEKKKDPTFIKPVEGEISVNFAKDNLVYSNTLQEWITHNGIDIAADKTTIVKASAEGIVRSIKNDPRYGITVVIEHNNGFSSVYANLLTTEFVKVGEEVSQGDTIGTVGNTGAFEIADEPHLHFEILKDGEYLNPEIYI